jgi:DNA-binding response OmpR family regulator
METQDNQRSTVTGRNGHILLVDDEEPIRKLITDVLTPRGFAITQCCSGGQAVEYYSRHVSDVDLVVMDIMMPGMNGTEALVRMRLIDPNVKVILISGGGYSQDDILKTGAVGFAAKPFQFLQLLELVKLHIRHEPSPSLTVCTP